LDNYLTPDAVNTLLATHFVAGNNQNAPGSLDTNKAIPVFLTVKQLKSYCASKSEYLHLANEGLAG
jgi:hypothetical protein